MRLLYDTYDEVTRRNTSIELDEETGLPLIVSAQDTKPILESAKALASNFDGHQARGAPFVHVARIPAVIYAQLTRLGITRDPVAFRVWLNSREARLLRTDDGRRL